MRPYQGGQRVAGSEPVAGLGQRGREPHIGDSVRVSPSLTAMAARLPERILGGRADAMGHQVTFVEMEHDMKKRRTDILRGVRQRFLRAGRETDVSFT